MTTIPMDTFNMSSMEDRMMVMTEKNRPNRLHICLIKSGKMSAFLNIYNPGKTSYDHLPHGHLQPVLHGGQDDGHDKQISQTGLMHVYQVRKKCILKYL
jgi:hypothetical protein